MGIVLGISNIVFVGAGYALARVTGAPGTEVDLFVTGVGVAAPPFYELLFDQETEANLHEALLPDAITRVRPRPLYRATNKAGPHDAIGFRSDGVPNRPDLITIGDSQTYGWNVALADNWPSQLGEIKKSTVYNMALGGWGGAQYHYITEKALKFSPRQLIVGLYMGNDSIESLTHAYKYPHFEEFRAPNKPSLADYNLKFMRPEPQDIVFQDGAITFTPTRRWFVNDRSNDAVIEGYRLLAQFACALGEKASAAGTSTTFVIIPTKETVYAPLMARDKIERPSIFDDLVAAEALNTAELEEALGSADLQVVNTTMALQQAVLSGVEAYPDWSDGHPTAAGHRIIAQKVAEALPASATSPKQMSRARFRVNL